jgi:AcrR family transcriptional regulator
LEGRSRTKEKEERVKEIIAVAKTVFFEKGYFDSTIDEIAQRAGISKGTVYLYFKNKDELYASLMLPMVGEFTELLLEFEKDLSKKRFKSGSEIIMKFYEIFTRIYQYDPDSLRVFQVYHLLDLSEVMGESVRKKHRLTAKKNGAIAVKIYSDAIDQGLLLPNNLIQAVNALWALFLGIVQVQGSYMRATQKDYVLETLKFSFSSFAKVLTRTPEWLKGEGR